MSVSPGHWSSAASPSRAVSSSVTPWEHVGGIRNVPWEGFLSRLWAGEIIA